MNAQRHKAQLDPNVGSDLSR